jgi:hypothetical protein
LRRQIHRSKPSIQLRLHPLLLTSPTSTRTQQTSNSIPTTKYSIPPSWSTFFGSVSGVPIIIYFRISRIHWFTVGPVYLGMAARTRRDLRADGGRAGRCGVVGGGRGGNGHSWGWGWLGGSNTIGLGLSTPSAPIKVKFGGGLTEQLLLVRCWSL